MNKDYEKGYQDALNDVWDRILSYYPVEDSISGTGDVWKILVDLGLEWREEDRDDPYSYHRRSLHCL